MFYTYNQNNSGGYFVVDDKAGICETVIIEANNAKQADSRLNEIGQEVEGFNDYCGCCGERWSTGWADDDEGTNEPTIYSAPLDSAEAGMFRTRCFIHYEDGSKTEYSFK